MPRVTQKQRELHVHDEQDFLTASAHAGEASPYRHDEYWGDDVDDMPADLERIERAKTPKELWIAKTVLRREATVLCPHCLENQEEAVPLSEPEEHVPREIVIPRKDGKNLIVELAVLPKAHRYCERCGLVSFGGPLADRDLEEFRAVLDELENSWLEPVLRGNRIPTAKQALGEVKATLEHMETKHNLGHLYRDARDDVAHLIEEIEEEDQMTFGPENAGVGGDD